MTLALSAFVDAPLSRFFEQTLDLAGEEIEFGGAKGRGSEARDVLGLLSQDFGVFSRPARVTVQRMSLLWPTLRNRCRCKNTVCGTSIVFSMLA